MRVSNPRTIAYFHFKTSFEGRAGLGSWGRDDRALMGLWSAAGAVGVLLLLFGSQSVGKRASTQGSLFRRQMGSVCSRRTSLRAVGKGSVPGGPGLLRGGVRPVPRRPVRQRADVGDALAAAGHRGAEPQPADHTFNFRDVCGQIATLGIFIFSMLGCLRRDPQLGPQGHRPSDSGLSACGSRVGSLSRCEHFERARFGQPSRHAPRSTIPNRPLGLAWPRKALLKAGDELGIATDKFFAERVAAGYGDRSCTGFYHHFDNLHFKHSVET